MGPASSHPNPATSFVVIYQSLAVEITVNLNIINNSLFDNHKNHQG